MTVRLVAWIAALVLTLPVLLLARTDRDRDGLVGPVRRVVMERVILASSPFRQGALSPTVIPVHVGRAAAAPPVDIQPDDRPLPRKLWRVLTYDARGWRTEATFYTDDGTLRWLWRYTYDERGKRLTRTSYDARGVVRWIWRYRYDDRGRLVEQTEFNHVGDLTRRWTYAYNAAGQRVEESSFQANGSLLWKWRYTYDAAGRQTQKAHYALHDSLVRSWHYTYDAHGHVQETANYGAFGTLLWRHHYAYDAQGNVTDETRLKGNGLITWKRHHAYAYDRVGNWVKRTTTLWLPRTGQMALKPSEMTYRTLTYDASTGSSRLP